MKKNFLSVVVIVAFVGYSLYQRLFGETTQVQSNFPTATATPAQLHQSPTNYTLQDTSTPPPSPTITPLSSSGYKDGTYIGDVADAFYGNIQVQATIAQGKITDVQFLQSPNDRRTSIEINQQATPVLAREAIAAQDAQVNVVSGATDSSRAFVQSLQSALDKAKI
jgi:uncharacterized protein with FMN-binding domain